VSARRQYNSTLSPTQTDASAAIAGWAEGGTGSMPKHLGYARVALELGDVRELVGTAQNATNVIPHAQPHRLTHKR